MKRTRAKLWSRDALGNCLPGGVLVLRCLGSGLGSREAWEGVRAVLQAGSPSGSISLLPDKPESSQGEGDLKPDPPSSSLRTLPESVWILQGPRNLLPRSTGFYILWRSNSQLQTHTFPKSDLRTKSLWNLKTSFYKFMRKISDFCPISILATTFKMFIW